MNVAAKILIGVLFSILGLVWVQHHGNQLSSTNPAINQTDQVQFSPSDSAKPSPAIKFSSKRRSPAKDSKLVGKNSEKKVIEAKSSQKAPVIDKPAE